LVDGHRAADILGRADVENVEENQDEGCDGKSGDNVSDLGRDNLEIL